MLLVILGKEREAKEEERSIPCPVHAFPVWPSPVRVRAVAPPPARVPAVPSSRCRRVRVGLVQIGLRVGGRAGRPLALRGRAGRRRRSRIGRVLLQNGRGTERNRQKEHRSRKCGDVVVGRSSSQKVCV
ncbi:hypothetical protein Nmel_006614 [Mimus melanotis]